MTKIFYLSLFVGAFFNAAYGQATKPGASGDAEAVKQLERDWVDAQKAGDVDKLGQLLADDWVGLGFDGAKSTKKQLLNEVKSGTSKLESFNMGPMDVKIIGAV
ncbi:MAG TPA: nuclear transport factor 2 family protein, partial [Candidatus Acidoferrales bacterium]|nr:nuclear transport factor 2 family protein [Candidatus Acidoferrales bacterium]